MSSRKSPAPFDPSAPFPAAFQAAIEGADAYRAVRAGLRLHDDILRIGNRFVALDRFREVAFLAFGNASGAMGLAAQEMLGERLTQGLSSGPVPPPSALQFRYAPVADAWPGSPEGTDALAQSLELARGLGTRDLLVVLLSPGALATLAGPPSGWDGTAWRELLESVAAGPGGTVDAVRVARGFGTGGVGGRLGAAAVNPTVATLVVDRGEGAEWVGGGPTIPLGPEERPEALARRLTLPATLASASPGGAALPSGRGANPVDRPVVVTGPSDAIESAGDQLAGQGWVSRLSAVHLDGPPEAVAAAFLASAEQIRVDQFGSAPTGPSLLAEAVVAPTVAISDALPDPSIGRRNRPRGLAVFATATFRTVEGGDEPSHVRAFLEACRSRRPARPTYVGAVRTAGAIAGRGEPPGSWLPGPLGGGSAGPAAPPARYALLPGFTDVGTLLVALEPWSAK